MKFTDKQRIFFREYARRQNVSEAAIAAGYAKKNARIVGYNILKKYPHEAKKLISKQHKKDIASLEEIREILTKFARGEKHEQCVVITGHEREAKLIDKYAIPKDQIKAAELLAKMEGAFIDRVEVSDAREASLHNAVVEKLKKRTIGIDLDEDEDED